jgi:hypothetical protein
MADELNIGALGALREVLIRALDATIRAEEAGRTDDRLVGRKVELVATLNRELERAEYYRARLTVSNVRLFPHRSTEPRDVSERVVLGPDVPA